MVYNKIDSFSQRIANQSTELNQISLFNTLLNNELNQAAYVQHNENTLEVTQFDGSSTEYLLNDSIIIRKAF